MLVLHVTYREFPPSSNQLYWGLKKTLTKKGKKYGEDFNKWMMQHHGHELNRIKDDGVYAIHLRFFFPTILNDSFENPKVHHTKRAKDRYKRFDLDNRIKLLQDCVVDFIGVDDSHFLASSQEKHQDPKDPRIEIMIQEVNPQDFGA